ncbi:nicotinamidase [Aeromonas sp. BIGb0445]|jgi:nicotinamidase/pyrazinamidase|uniref:nicotinamidase n=1 Tax=Aeromonas sp. BIGb0445 TaxID=2940593 RepID=UPI0021689101|nr:nicotinamidase [Aeromonas sp. BIGb0445]MCS3460847.1 nicotinamidase/pyrazinamidase [Aeromonas sp. BIGb0445]
MGIIASLDIDAQKGFTPLCPDELPVPGGDEIVAALNGQAALASLRIGSKDAHPRAPLWVTGQPLTPLPHANVDLSWPSHCVPGTQGFELLDGLPAPIDYDFFVWKGIEPDLHPYGACYHDLAGRRSTGLIEFLRSRNVSTVLAGGLATDYCVKTSVLQLRHAGFRVIVHLDACRGIAPETIASAHVQMTEAGAELARSLTDIQRLLDA